MELEQRAQLIFQENEQLRQVAERAATQATQPQEDPLVEELLAVQRVNLARFKRLHQLHLQARQQAGSAADQQELEALRSRYEALLKNQGSAEEQKELLEKLSEYRGFITQLKEQNRDLKERLQTERSNDDSRVEELEAKLREALKAGSGHQQMEVELNSLRKAMESKENQIQKVASRLSDNEKRLAKAMQESARLTELLIERENRLREVSEEYEQEYRDKLENLDRQVSGLQWKLSLREERIAHLESELQRKG
jgi:chromosome segregation ATPase